MVIPSTRLAPFDNPDSSDDSEVSEVSEIDLAGEESGGQRTLPTGTHEAEFDHLYREFSLRVVGLVRKFVTDDHQVDDIVQETFLRAYNADLHLEYLEEPEESGRTQWPWLAAVARNLSLDALRKRKSALEDEIDEELFEIETNLDHPEVRLQASRRYDGIVEALNEMCPRQSRLLLLRHVEGVDYVDLARHEGISVEALKSVIARARRTFKQTYTAIADRHGLGVAVGGFVAHGKARLRALRDRILGAPDAVNAAAAGSPAFTNAVVSLAVLGAVGVAGAVAGNPASPGPEPTPIVSESPAPTEVAAPAPEPVVVTVEPEPVSVGVAAPDPEPAPEFEATPAATPDPAPATEPSGTQAEASVDSDDVVPVDDSPAGSQAKASLDQDDQTTTLQTDASADSPAQDLGVERDTWVNCPPPDERGVTMTVVCTGTDAL